MTIEPMTLTRHSISPPDSPSSFTACSARTGPSAVLDIRSATGPHTEGEYRLVIARVPLSADVERRIPTS